MAEFEVPEPGGAFGDGSKPLHEPSGSLSKFVGEFGDQGESESEDMGFRVEAICRSESGPLPELIEDGSVVRRIWAMAERHIDLRSYSALRNAARSAFSCAVNPILNLVS